MTLSILIPCTHDRKAAYDSLYAELLRQCLKYGSDIEILSMWDNKEIPLGKKRNMLYNQAEGKYSWQIDSDDWIDCEAVDFIMEAVKEDSDCITFREYCRINGVEYTSNHSLKYDDWADNHDGFNYVRTPFYKDIIKTEIAVKHPIPEHMRYGEDHAQARILRQVLKSETHIDKEIYHYIHFSKPEDHNNRYGIDK